MPYYVCKTCSYGASAPEETVSFIDKLDAHEVETGHKMECVEES